MPKVLRIINRFNVGGPTYNAANLTKYLSPEYETLLIGGEAEEHEASSTYILDQLNIPYTIIPEMSRKVSAFQDVMAYRSIEKIIREFKPDIVHTHASKAGALGRIAAHRAGVKVIVHTFHGHVFEHYFGRFKSGLVQKVERFLAKRSDAIIAISDLQQVDLVTRFQIAPAEKVHRIPLGFDLKKFASHQELKRSTFRNEWGIRDEECAVGIIGRLAPIKNHLFFLEAMYEVMRIKPSVKAFVIGDGELRNELEDKVREWGLNDRIFFTSWIKDVDVVLAGLDIVALSSLNEGTPVSLIEAQAAQRPIVTTDAGGVKNAVIENESAFIVSNPSDMSSRILELESSFALRKKMGQAGFDFVKARFSVERLIRDVRNLYDQLLR